MGDPYTYQGLREENERLKIEVMELRSKLEQLEEMGKPRTRRDGFARSAAASFTLTRKKDGSRPSFPALGKPELERVVNEPRIYCYNSIFGMGL